MDDPANAPMDEDNISDASLVEDDEDAAAASAGPSAALPARLSAVRSSTEDDNASSTGSIIDLPGMPVTAPVDAGPSAEIETAAVASTGVDDPSDPLPANADDRFFGFPQEEQNEAQRVKALKRKHLQQEISADDLEPEGVTLMPAGFVPPPTSPPKAASIARPQRGLPPPPPLQPSPAARQPQRPPQMTSPRRTAASSAAPPGRTQPTTMSSRRESREWRPSAVLFKPFTAGWVREVIYKQNADGTYNHDTQPQIAYHAPRVPGTKPRMFKAVGELVSYIKFADQSLSVHNFSFRREPMGGAPGQEVLRGENEKVELFPHQDVPEAAPQVAGKRTPKASAKAAAAAAAPSSNLQSVPSSNGGGLKLKVFSKMKEKNSLDMGGSGDFAQPTASSMLDGGYAAGAAAAGGFGASSPPAASGFGASPSTSHQPPPAKRRSFTPKTAAGATTSQPTVSITPVSAASRSGGGKYGKSGGSWSHGPSSSSSGRPVIRPTHSKPVSCNIHCQGVAGFPTLSCHSCQSMFHPRCVGLVDGMDYEAHYDFYCVACQPPGKQQHQQPQQQQQNKENNSFSHLPAGGSRRSGGGFGGARGGGGGGGGGAASAMGPKDFGPHGLPKGLSIIPSSAKAKMAGTNSKPSSPANYRSGARGGLVNGMGDGSGGMGQKSSLTPGSTTSVRSSSNASSVPNSGAPAPIEAQSVVNIGGTKYLVVPHPSTKPQPAQSPATHMGRNHVEALAASRAEAQAAAASALAASKAGRLLLKPVEEGSPMPSFEVEEGPDGRLVLVPLDQSLRGNPFANAQHQQGQPKPNAAVASSSNLGKNFHSNLSSSYTAMLHVFKYLTLTEKLRASSVCRLWRDMIGNDSLWGTVSLKNVRVLDWGAAVSFFERHSTRRLDMRRLVHAKAVDESWRDMASAFARLRSVRRLEFPRAPSSALITVAEAMAPGQLSELAANNLSPKEVDLEAVASLASVQDSLSDLRLRGVAGKMKVVTGLGPLKSLKSTLTKLSLLGMESVSPADLESLSSLTGLQSLDLGDCSSSAPEDVFRSLTTLHQLRSLRLEKSRDVGTAVGELRWLQQLEKLELIEVTLKEGFGDGLVKLASLKKMLLIPQYKDEVASINAEIVDSAPSMVGLSHFFLGLTNEWLQSMSSLMSAANPGMAGAGGKDSFPILVGGTCEMFSLSKLFKTLSGTMPNCRVKILKMSQQAVGKQFIDSLIR